MGRGVLTMEEEQEVSERESRGETKVRFGDKDVSVDQYPRGEGWCRRSGDHGPRGGGMGRNSNQRVVMVAGDYGCRGVHDWGGALGGGRGRRSDP